VTSQLFLLRVLLLTKFLYCGKYYLSHGLITIIIILKKKKPTFRDNFNPWPFLADVIFLQERLKRAITWRQHKCLISSVEILPPPYIYLCPSESSFQYCKINLEFKAQKNFCTLRLSTCIDCGFMYRSLPQRVKQLLVLQTVSRLTMYCSRYFF